MVKKVSLISIGFIAILILLATIYRSASVAVPINDSGIKTLHFVRNAIKVDFFNNSVDAKLVMKNPERIKTSGTLYVSIMDPSGNIATTAQQDVRLDGNISNTFHVNLPTSLDRAKLQTYRLKYTFKYDQKNAEAKPNTRYVARYKKIEGIKSIYSCYDHLAVKLLAQNSFISGAPAAFRLVAFNPSDNMPVSNADIKINLQDSKSNVQTLLYTGRTNNDGTVNASFEIPDNLNGGYNLKIALASTGNEKIVEEISQPITIKRDYKIMLSTDKPIYQPNQTMKLRALALNAGNLKPIANKQSVIEVYDAKGNKVFKKKTETNDFGIISADFTLADEVNMGNYKIKAIIDDIDSEKTVKVSRYVLPKFKVAIKTDKDYYLPSETVKGTIDVNYFFGKTVKDASVKVKVDKFDIGFSRIEEVTGTTDDNGAFEFEIKLPDNFVGQNLASGNALVKFDIEVKDTADHIEKKTSSVMVSQQPINIVVIPESGSLAKNVTNKVYVMTTYPDGTPTKTSIIATVTDKEYKINADSTGIAAFEVTPNGEDLQVEVSAVDSKGNQAKNNFNLTTNTSDQSVLLRTDKSIAKVGDTINLQAISTKSKGTVYIDMIKNGQTVLTKSMDLNSGKAEMAFDIPAELVGTVGINAYIIDQSSEIIRDSKIVYINPAEDLIINVKADKKTYKPGEDAIINFKVTDSNKHPILAALGVYVVDESVFALSELQPGLEKIFFTLEEEILKPRFEIHGITPGEIVKPAEKDEVLAKRQQEAAKVLFAAANELKDYNVKVDTYKDNLNNLVNAYRNPLYNQINNIRNGLYKYERQHKEYPKTDGGVELLIDKGYIKTADLIDPWGNKVVVLPYDENQKFLYSIYIISKGPDGIAGTADDIIMTQWNAMLLGADLDDLSALKMVFEGKGFNNEKIKELSGIRNKLGQMVHRRDRMLVDEEMMMADGVAGMGRMVFAEKAAPARSMMANEAKKEIMPCAAPCDKAKTPDKASVRVREYFPETLYANAAVITDASGIGSITIPMADSITTWRLTAMGNSMDGLLGSTTSGIRVFQDFFIDIDLPVALTENDKVSIPIAIYNYLPTEQTIKLEMEQEDWFDSMDNMTKEVTLGSNEVSVEYFTIQVKKLGNHTLTVYAMGTNMSDAIKRKVAVEPDGEEFRDSINGRLESDVSQVVNIPQDSIDDASRILVKIYPGFLSQVVEGLDKIFRMPSGCFEQTSSSTYPNVLVLDYMKRTKQITPEIQMKAESYINSGYQRLLTFEVPGGGFDWFGRPPANKILTAYGLMEFYDMSAVHEVDPNLISRTQNWLVNKQETDGSFKPDEGGIEEGAINQYKGHTLRTTAYITWALKSSNYDGPAVDKAIEYIKSHLKEADDAYTYAVLANLFVLVDPDDVTTADIFKSLIKLKKEEGDTVYWEQKGNTPMYGGGQSANIEVTALATIALINYGKDISVTNKAINYLISSKDSYGTWHSTQATILSMKALLMSLSNATQKVDAKVTVSIDGIDVETYSINQDNSDVLKQIDLKKFTKKGKNNVDIKISGTGSMLYQIVSIYYLPWELLSQPKVPMLAIDVEYDKTTLEKNDVATANVTVQNNTKDTADMVIVDLGIPPGFKVETEDLDKMVQDNVITKYSIAARQVILYFDKIKANDTVKFQYKVKAKISIKAKSGKSKIYKYYEPEVNGTSEPVEIKVI